MKPLYLFFAVVVLVSSCLSKPEPLPQEVRLGEFPASLRWKNVSGRLHQSNLSGYTTILAFFDPRDPKMLPEIIAIDAMDSREILVIPVLIGPEASQSAEKLLIRYGLSNPIGVDLSSHFSRTLGVIEYPSYVIVRADGVIAGGIPGSIRGVDLSLIDDLAAAETDQTRWKIHAMSPLTGQRSILTYPSSVVGDSRRNLIYVADSGGHRVMAVRPQTGEVLAIAGTGEKGYTDAPIQKALFNAPLGMALSDDGKLLLVADSGNSMLRGIDLDTQGVSTIATFPDGTPYDVEVAGSATYVSIAGQGIARLDISSGDYTLIHSLEGPRSSAPYDEGWDILTPITYRANSLGHSVKVENALDLTALPLHGDPLFVLRDRTPPVVHPTAALGTGRGIIRFTTAIPTGYELVDELPNHALWSIIGSGAQIVAAADPSTDIFEEPVEVIVDLLPGEGELSLELSLIYRHIETHIMFAHSGTLVVPFTVGNTQRRLYTLEYRVPGGSQGGHQY